MPDDQKTTVMEKVPLPSDYVVEWQAHPFLGYRWRVAWKKTPDDEGIISRIVVPNQIGGLIEHIPAWKWAITEKGAKLKAARAIETLCKPPRAIAQMDGKKAVRELSAHERANRFP